MGIGHSKSEQACWAWKKVMHHRKVSNDDGIPEVVDKDHILIQSMSRCFSSALQGTSSLPGPGPEAL